ncbi:zinc metalloprotease [Streptomyces yaizuensis]|uniref:Uncharacterized protein n=1 Tax=Streptomyces yaizuensis TaxID=2989713 RepID=A0ABQ5P601_9ACTN|nr:hypothetical protein [Streptomyces sp. YSPA8]GLF97883.1 hypothetical protein SYYSPA8_26320 [Streptomyces sp. YSPA8]
MGFMRYKATGFSWVLAAPAGSEWRLLFSQGSEGALINEQQRIGSDYLTGLAPQLFYFHQRGLALGALLLSQPGESQQSIFFWGDNHYWYDWEKQSTLSEGRWTKLANWGTALPADYRFEIDVLFQAPNAADGSRQTYFFKGGRVLTLNWSTGVVREALITDGPDASGCAGWAALPEDFRSGLDHVAPYKPAADGTRQSLLIKGAQGVLLNWKTGVLASGALDRLGVPGLAALPEHYRTAYRPVTGRWTGTLGNQRVEVRVDLEGERTLGVISGDLFTGDTWTDSFRTTAEIIALSSRNHLVVDSLGLSWANNSPWTQVVLQLPRVAASSPMPTAHFALLSRDNTPSLQLTCSYVGPALRSVELETDAMAGTQVFQSYDTSRGSWVPRGYRNRVLTLASAYAEAGIELKNAGQVNVVADTSGADLKWSEAELHAAMEANFSLHRDAEQWKIWNFIGTYHSYHDGVAGIMFDQTGRQRQGVAIFYNSLRDYNCLGTAMELFTYVHELGHVFNMLHSWDKNLAVPPAPLGPNSGFGELSWMNYPALYNNGAGRAEGQHFWQDFPYRFSDNELRHLRHGFHRHIVPGGDNALTNAALDLSATAQTFTLPGAGEDPGLSLSLGGKQFFGHGEPVMAELRLSRTGVTGDVTVAGSIGPKGERTKVVITDPYGRTRVFRPIARTCSGHGEAEGTVTLTEANPAVYETAYLGYGSDGLYFAEPGAYQVTAVHTGLDGARTVSPTRTLRVRTPLDRADQEVGEFLTGDDQGTLLAFLGSDAPHLTAGNDALQELIERHGDHPLAAYARLARGANAGRHFQTIGGGSVQVRQPDIAESVTQLTEAITTSRTDQETGLDNLTLNAAFRRLATVHAKAGDLERAEATLDTLTAHFQEQGVPAHVQERIQEQADTARAAIRETVGEQPES